ncbi:hypothetical protein RB601_001796 [Gaeumannomyces tritici]
MFVAPRGRRPLTLVLGIFAFFALVLYSSGSRPYYTPTTFGSRPLTKAPLQPAVSYEHDRPSSELVQFWTEVLDAMLQLKPNAAPIKKMELPPLKFFTPEELKADEPWTRYDGLELSSRDVEGIRGTHAQFVAVSKQLAPRMPYRRHSRGIVMTAGGKYIGNAILSLLMLRRTGSTLPVQLFLDSPDKYATEMCDTTMVELDVECRSMDAVFKTTPQLPKLKKFQYKVFSILFSSFEDVLFLDADAFPIHNPDHLFDVEPFRSRGMVTWPDFWVSTSSRHFYDIAGIPVPPIETRRSSESGVMLYSRRTHAESLLLSTYYNFYGPDYYYKLLCQGAHGEGDKETFMHAALALNKPFYDVKTNMQFGGRWINGSYETSAMMQADPMEDYSLNARLTGMAKNATFLGITDARYFFIHQNVIKLNMNKLRESMEPAWRKDEKGYPQRLWGDQSRLAETAGFDVEKAMWEEIIQVNCHHSFLAECNQLRRWYKLVFPDPNAKKKGDQGDEKDEKAGKKEEVKADEKKEENKVEGKTERRRRRSSAR